MLWIEEGKDYADVDDTQLPYKLLRSLGHGHSGNVEAVRDRLKNRDFARKTIFLPTARLSRKERTKVFLNEVAIIRSLGSHHHIISIFATYATKHELSLILHPVANQKDLSKFLEEYWDTVREIEECEITQHEAEGYKVAERDCPRSRLKAMIPVLERAFGCLALGLTFMHHKQVRHKDVKPHNILVHDGLVLYTDFGYSLDSSAIGRSTTEGTPSFLTMRYSAPEVIEHEKRDSRADVYSLGCVNVELFAALTLAVVPDKDKPFAKSMDKIHQEIDTWTVSSRLPSLLQIDSRNMFSRLSPLPTIIKLMTMRDPSERKCAMHTAIKILKIPELCCVECKTTHVDDTAECVKIHKCIRDQTAGNGHIQLTKVGEIPHDINSTGHGNSSSRLKADVDPILKLDAKLMAARPAESSKAGLSEDMRLISASYEDSQPVGALERRTTVLGPLRPLPNAPTDDTSSDAGAAIGDPNEFTLPSVVTTIESEATWCDADESYILASFDQSENLVYRSLEPSLNDPEDPVVKNRLERTETLTPWNYVHHPEPLFTPPEDETDCSDSPPLIDDPYNNIHYGSDPEPPVPPMSTLPPDMQKILGYRSQRHIRSSQDENDAEALDSKYCRVPRDQREEFFATGRVFRMLSPVPDDVMSPGKTRGSTHFSTNRGTFSQCIPIQTYRGQGATKPGLVQYDHGVVHTSKTAPDLEPGEVLTKWSLHVEPTGSETLEATSRVNYGRPYAVEHNVKVLGIGMVTEDQRYIIGAYYKNTLGLW